MVIGDEKVGMLPKQKKKSKKSNKNAATNGPGVEVADVEMLNGDFSFEEEKLSVVETKKERNKAKMETKTVGESDDRDIKKKKKREGGKHPGKSIKGSDEDVAISVEKKKPNKLKRSHQDERELLLDAPLDTKTIAHASASETRDSKKVVEALSEVSGGDAVEEIRRKKKSKKCNNNAPTRGVGLTNSDVRAVEGDLSLEEEKLCVVKTRKEKDKVNKEIKAAGESEDYDVKRKKERKSRTFNKDCAEAALKNVEKKSNKLKKSCRDEQETMHHIKDGQGDIMAEVNQGDISSPVEEIEEQSRTDNGNIRKRKKVMLGHSSEDPTHEKSEKRVRFSGHVQIFPSSGDPSDENHETEEENLLRGKRFSKLEDEIVKEAVHKYIDIHNLGEEGLHKILNSRSNPEVKGCWKEIGSAIPYRPYTAVYYRAQVLFRRSETRKWTEEEYEMVRNFHKEHGNNWKVLADELGKHRFHVKDTWRRLKLANKKKGQWSQEEYQTLFDLVNTDLKLKLSEEKKSKHGMLRDNIAWGAISDRLSTRTDATCCLKWYDQLTSPMVAKGEWADTDDYRLVDALFELDASCIEDVDWDNVLDHRPGEICRKRWNQMVLHIGQHGNRSFAEQVEVLAKRYRPELVEVREAWDSKPVIP
ncbi:uncharacterized protein LOC107793427 [Nicotiana tabacum]|uniref:Transcription termination factor 1 n=2 Tax=Nicotiana TaxID=4085 RepID=A0A1S4A3L0_TOBAC|nr:PREDICTED: transcription termination factor 1-like [Nicotiana sylvestris]XP_016471261.1 PREDICTED: transcription termination factor 1-like [Nicotiana tabacum]XP_016471262.1 PREDICTED: transcription termination factor 1-like [Nicotiana tabacum]